MGAGIRPRWPGLPGRAEIARGASGGLPVCGLGETSGAAGPLESRSAQSAYPYDDGVESSRSPQEILERRLYSYGAVDRILGITPGTARRWIDGYERSGHWYPPVVRPMATGAEWVTWGEFIEVYYLARFRGTGIPLQKLRATLASVRERTEHHYLFAHDDVLYADRDRLEVIDQIQREEGFPTFLVKRTGQLELAIESEARLRLERISYRDGVAQALKPRMDIDHIVVRADRFFGKPKIDDTGISPDAVARLVQAGTPVEVVADLYDLTQEAINDAGRFSYGENWLSAA